MKKICLLLTFVFVMLLGVSALADMDVKELTVQFVPTNTETADATTAEFSAYMTELMGIPVKMTVATSYNAIVEAMESGTVDVGIMPPATYAQAREMGEGHPLHDAQRLRRERAADAGRSGWQLQG